MKSTIQLIRTSTSQILVFLFLSLLVLTTSLFIKRKSKMRVVLGLALGDLLLLVIFEVANADFAIVSGI